MKVIKLLAVILLLVGCTTTRNVAKQNEASQVKTKNDISQSVAVKSSNTTAEALTDKTLTEDSASAVEQTTEWSKPDSTGKQYPVKTSTRIERKKSTRHSDISFSKKEKKEVDSSALTTDKSKIKAEGSKKNKQKDVKRTNLLMPILLCFIVLIMIVSGYCYYKQYK